MLPFARFRHGAPDWLCVQPCPGFHRPLCERPRLSTPGVLGSGAGYVVPLPLAYYDPIRQSRGHAATSQPCCLYAAPSLCGSAEATHETFPTFAAVLSTRAIDHTPVGPWCSPVVFAPRVPGCLEFEPSRHPQASGSASNSRRRIHFRRCIVRFMLRLVCLPGPPDWLRQSEVICSPLRLLRYRVTPAFDAWPSPASVGDQARWSNGKPPIIGTFTRPVTAASEAALELRIDRARPSSDSKFAIRNSKSAIPWFR